jgi:hypothetical protein
LSESPGQKPVVRVLLYCFKPPCRRRRLRRRLGRQVMTSSVDVVAAGVVDGDP